MADIESTCNSKLKYFNNIYNQDIDINELRKFCSNGIPDFIGLRSFCWKILLNYIPCKKIEREQVLLNSRLNYKKFVSQLIVNPFKEFNDKNSNTPVIGKNIKWQTVTSDDDPLSTSNNSWTEYYKDEQLRDEINKDVRRTHSNFHFFAANPLDDPDRPSELTADQITSFKIAEKLSISPRAKDNGFNIDKLVDSTNKINIDDIPISKLNPTDYHYEYASKSDGKKSDPHSELNNHHAALSRILFIYAKLNPGIRYVQGMNEILAPIYYVFCQERRLLDDGKLCSEEAEPDAFYCFSKIMASLRDRFLKSLDKSSHGIMASVDNMQKLLDRIDHEVADHLQKMHVDPRLFAFRWMSLLLSQDFDIPEVIRIWDALFSDPCLDDGFIYLNYVCVSMIILIRDVLLPGDFSDCIKALQRYPNIDVENILRIASDLYKLYSN